MNENTTHPQTLQEAILYFSDPNVCLSFVVSLRWPNGVVCPHCSSTEHSFLTTRRIWKCKGCKKQFSVKVGTIFEDSAVGLDKWLCAIWMLANDKNGISSYEVHRAIGVTQKTAWFMLHRIRLAMQTGTFEKLSGEVEADETFVGGKAANMHKAKREARIKGRGATGKAVVMGLLERDGNVQATVVSDTKKETLQGEVRQRVTTDSAVYTDALPSYIGLSPEYDHAIVDHAVEYVNGRVHTNGIENFWSLFKRCIKGTYVSVDPHHLLHYVDEEVFRFNERKGKDATRFAHVLQGVTGKRLTYQQLINENRSGAHD